jgi:hypothetical protein
MSGFVRATKPGDVARPKPLRSLASLGSTQPETRDCGCDDGCCR